MNQTVSKVEHTPGPWRFVEGRLPLKVFAGKGELATVARSPGDGMSNGRLIAAAPDLLIACEAMVLAAKLNDPAMGGVAATLADAAIAKATGQTNEHSADQPRL